MMLHKPTIGLSQEEFEMYLDLLKNIAGDETYSTSGTVFCVNSKTGEMMNIEFENYMGLKQTLELKWSNYQMIRMEQELQQKKENKPEVKKSKGMGM